MKTLIDLAKEVQNDPANVTSILSSFRTTSSEVKLFLLSLQSVPPYMVPALLRTFAANHREDEPKFVSDLMAQNRFMDCFFTLTEDGTDWTYLGVSSNGKALCRPINSNLVMEINAEKQIKYAF